jgi:hypothetical protein
MKEYFGSGEKSYCFKQSIFALTGYLQQSDYLSKRALPFTFFD